MLGFKDTDKNNVFATHVSNMAIRYCLHKKD